MTNVSDDKPLASPEDDRLGYAPFAKHLADSICKMSPPTGLVLALYGSWGSGKSTVLNFIAYHLEQMEEDSQPIVVRFNPWWFSGHEDLTRLFFEQLEITLGRKLKDVFKKVTHLVRGLADVVSAVPIPGTEVPQKITELFPGLDQKDVIEIKEKLGGELKKHNKRVLIVIDDIDRLTAEEIKQLFRVIKTVADLPNVVYLLAFDKEVVTSALEEAQGKNVSGEAYLEKIVQVPFGLPIPDRIALSRLLSEKLDEILIGTSDDLWDGTYWGNIFHDGVKHFITTPRHVNRLINALNVMYPSVKGEVHPVDFIAIETLRIFNPFVYDVIRNNTRWFVGSLEYYDTNPQLELLRSFHNTWLSQLADEDKELVKRLLKRLFPKLENIDHMGRVIHSDWKTMWRKQLRICSPDVVETYFRFSVPTGNLPNDEMKTIVASVNNVDVFSEKLLELAAQKRPDGVSYAQEFLDRFLDYLDDIPPESIPAVVETFFTVGDKLVLLEDEEPLVPFGDNETRIGRIILRSLLQFNEPDRLNMLCEAMRDGQSLFIIVDIVRYLGSQHGKYGQQPDPEEKRIVTVEHLAKLENLVLDKIRKLSHSDALLEVKRLPPILSFWQDLADDSEVSTWVQEQVNTDFKLVLFVEQFLQKTHSWSVVDVVTRMRYRLKPKQLEPYFDVSRIAEQLKRIVKSDWLTEKQTIAVNQFLEEYEMLQRGQDPDHMF